MPKGFSEMKICPTCNKTFVEDHLSFCTACGTPLTFPSQGSGSGYTPQQEPPPPSPFSDPGGQPPVPPSFKDPTPSLPSSMETMIAPPSLFSDPQSYGGGQPPQSNPPFYNEPPQQQSNPFGEQQTVNRPFSEPAPPPNYSNDPFQPMFGVNSPQQVKHYGQQPSQPEWMPPPPPIPNWNVSNNPGGIGYSPHSMGPNQGLALASLITGISSITIGLCCYLGTLLGPAAIILGIIALIQIKNNPTAYTGKGMAIGGITMGALYFVLVIFFLLLNIGISILPALLGA